MTKKFLKPSSLIRISVMLLYLTFTGEAISGRSYIDYPEFQERVARSCKSLRAPWTSGETNGYCLNFPYRFACGKLVKVYVGWNVLSTERQVIQAEKNQAHRTSNSSLLEKHNVAIWEKANLTYPNITPEAFFKDHCKDYENLHGNSNILIVPHENMQTRIKFYCKTQKITKVDLKNWGFADKSALEESLKGRVGGMGGHRGEVGVVFDPATHLKEKNDCIMQ
ncbi:MAG: hypothetical protein BGO67_08930 [Alphaproteobacteria bacterium 41-28]|nr:MAG: hypothetical protein BGO67_08930 [Alphaproteobacteria bacterium 41-28]